MVQTNKLRAKTNTILQLLFDLPHESVAKANHKELKVCLLDYFTNLSSDYKSVNVSNGTSVHFQIVYPSHRRGLEIKAQNPHMTNEVVTDLYENFDRWVLSSYFCISILFGYEKWNKQLFAYG